MFFTGYQRKGLWSHRESNSDLIFRRDLFYPLNYETPMHLCAHRFFVTIAKVTFFFVYLAFYG